MMSPKQLVILSQAKDLSQAWAPRQVHSHDARFDCVGSSLRSE
jgi:hypothetical protein